MAPKWGANVMRLFQNIIATNEILAIRVIYHERGLPSSPVTGGILTRYIPKNGTLEQPHLREPILLMKAIFHTTFEKRARTAATVRNN